MPHPPDVSFLQCRGCGQHPCSQWSVCPHPSVPPVSEVCVGGGGGACGDECMYLHVYICMYVCIYMDLCACVCEGSWGLLQDLTCLVYLYQRTCTLSLSQFMFEIYTP